MCFPLQLDDPNLEPGTKVLFAHDCPAVCEPSPVRSGSGPDPAESMARVSTAPFAPLPPPQVGGQASAAPAASSLRYANTLLGFPVLLGGLIVAFLSLFLPAAIADPDIWWHLRNAQLQLTSHRFLTQDVYSSTAAGAPWTNHEWLSELPFYIAWKVAGPSGLRVLTLATLALLFIGIFALGYLYSANLRSAFACTIVSVFFSTVSFGPRTLIFGWLCLTAELLAIELYQRAQAPAQSYYACIFPLLFLFWINLHGSWIIGIVVFLVWFGAGIVRCHTGAIASEPWTPRQARTLLLSGATSVGALLINPYGWRLIAYPFDLAFRQKLNIASVEEWRTLDFHSPRGKAFFLVFALVMIGSLIRTRKWALYELAFVAIGTYSALTYSRFLFLAALLAIPLFAKDLSLWIPARPTPDRPWLNGIILAGLVLLVSGWQRSSPSCLSPEYPTRAVGYLKAFRPRGRVFNDYLWGGYLIWNTPQIPVFIDSRVDLFERNGAFKDYLDAAHIVNSFAILDKYDIQYVLFRRDTPLVYLLSHTSGWTIDYQDETTVLLERKAAGRS